MALFSVIASLFPAYNTFENKTLLRFYYIFNED